MTQQKFTYLIVHGAWGGAWSFKQVDRLLTADGHIVYRPTLTGQGERAHLANTSIDLNTHIKDITNVILFEELKDFILVGHSYGGMVITGVADQMADRIAHVIYLDAFVPENGENVYAIRPPAKQPNPVVDGFEYTKSIVPGQPPPCNVPQSVKTFSQPIALTNPAAQSLPTTYALFLEPGKQPENSGF